MAGKYTPLMAEELKIPPTKFIYDKFDCLITVESGNSPGATLVMPLIEKCLFQVKLLFISIRP
jgi:hypothetical protein